MYRHVANSSRTARQLLPPARRRSTSSGVCDPNSLACDPLGQRITVPPGAWTRRAPGSALRMPPGPSYMEVTPSPKVGAMMAIQWGTGPGRQGGPLTCWRTYSEQAFDLPAPRPAMRSQPVQSPLGGIWWGWGCQRGLSWAARRAAARSAIRARSSVVMGGLSPSAASVVSGAGVAAVGLAAGVLRSVMPGPASTGQVHDLRSGGEAAEGEVPVLAAPMAADGAAGRRGVEADLLGEAGADEDGDGRLVGVGAVPRFAEEHRERVGAAFHAEPGVDVVGARLA